MSKEVSNTSLSTKLFFVDVSREDNRNIETILLDKTQI